MKKYSRFKISALLIFNAFIILQSSNTNGQELRHYRINIQSGVALPYGQLASKHFNSGGYAVYGTGSTVEGLWQFNPHLAAGMAFSVSRFPFDDNTYAQNLVNSDVFMDYLYMKSDNYDALTYTASVYYTRPVWKKISLTANLGGGMIWAQTPDQLFSATYSLGIKKTYKITPSHDKKPVLTTGLACHYQLFDHVDISLHANYYLADMGFGFYTSTDFYTRWLTFSYLNAGLGIGITF
jgi:hypothetical protein